MPKNKHKRKRRIKNKLTLPNFRSGMRVGNIDEDDQILSLRNMVNADIDFRTGAAVRRNGYSYFLQTLAAQAKQIEEFYDTVGHSNLLLIMDDKLYWYRSTDTTLYEVKNASVSPTTSLSFVTYTHYPFLTVGDRCFFADDNGFWWVDNTSLVWENPPATPLPLCYQVGIDAPSDIALSLTSGQSEGFELAGGLVGLAGIGLDVGVRDKMAQSFQVAVAMDIDAIRLPISGAGFSDAGGGIKLGIYTDSGGDPDTTSPLTNAETSVNLQDVEIGATPEWLRFSFTSKVTLAATTTYWIVIEGDAGYIANYNIATDYALWWYDDAGGYASGKAVYYDGSWNDLLNSGDADDFAFQLGGQLDGDGVDGYEYRYSITYHNGTYPMESSPNIEHIPADSIRVFTVAGDPAKTTVSISSIVSSVDDAQVTHIRLYRTKSGDTSIFYLVDEFAIGATSYVDAVADVNLGAELQTADHTRLTDRDDNLIVPRHLEWWQHRIWAVPAVSDAFYYSKRLEQAGASGVAGDPAYDYYPQEASYRNDWDVDSTIIAMKVHENRLIVYTDRHDVHIFSGATQPLNPPPDLYHEHLIIGEGVLGYRGLVDLRGKHVFITQDKEIKGFVGTIDMEDISDVMDSVLVDLTTIHAFVWNNQYMLLGDSNSDGVMDTIYILDLSRRTLNPWRKYEYKNNVTVVEIKDVVLTNAGVLYAVAKVGSVYHVIQLDSGTSDGWTTLENDGTAITKELLTHDIRPARRAFWQEVGMRGYYPTSTIPTYVTTCTDLTGETTTSAFDPSSSEDMLGHVHGLRMASNELSLKIKSTGSEKDEIRELFVRYRL